MRHISLFFHLVKYDHPKMHRSMGVTLFILTVVMWIVIWMNVALLAEAKSEIEGGMGLGAVTGTPGSNKFAEIFYFDWAIAREQGTSLGRVWASVGPMVQLVAPGSYTQVAGAVVTKFHWFPGSKENGQKIFGIVPFLGLGGTHAQLKADNAPTLRDMSYYGTLGVSLDINPIDRFGISATYMHNFYDITFGNGQAPDRGSDGFFLSVRIRL
jgi:hypothetical protein